MATATVNLIPETGRLFTPLTSWAGDAGFAVTPVANDQLEYPSALTAANDGTVTGPNGTYTLRHVTQLGGIEAVSYLIGSADTTAPVLSNATAARNGINAVDATVATNEANGTLYALISTNATETAANIIATGVSQVVNATGTQSVSFTGLNLGTVYYVHFVHVDAAGNESAVDVSPSVATQQSATVSANLVVGSSRNLATLVSPIEPYLFQGWIRQPVPGEQLIAQASSGSFDQYGNFQSDLEAILPIHFVALDGTIHRLTIDTTGLDSVQDTKPAAFSFTTLTNVARSLAQTSNSITVTDIDAGLDIPIEVEDGEYSVSLDGGSTWSLWTTTAGTVKLNDRVRVRHQSAATYNTTITTTLRIGPSGNRQTGTFSSTTLADTVKPTISLVGGNITLVQGTPFVEPGYTANDNADGNITMQVQVTGTINENQLGPQTLTYYVEDQAGNSATTTRTVTVVAFVPDDTTAPVISLTGGNRTITVGDTWIDPGYTATDDTDGNLTAQVQVTGTVNTAIAGSYPITYTVSDSTGNVGTATRIVTVLPATNYPFDAAAPDRRTLKAVRAYRPEIGSKVFYLQAGETLDYDFDLSVWLAEQGDDIAEGSYQVTEMSDALQAMAVGTVAGQDRVKVWLRGDAVTESEAVPLELTITTTGYRTAKFQILMILIDRMH